LPARESEIRTSTGRSFLIRPDTHLAWAATIDQRTGTAVLALRDALSDWFGKSSKRPRASFETRFDRP
jgi:Aromatic-ring hydroxylase, C-terminal